MDAGAQIDAGEAKSAQTVAADRIRETQRLAPLTDEARAGDQLDALRAGVTATTPQLDAQNGGNPRLVEARGTVLAA
jgi:hypothetical protein